MHFENPNIDKQAINNQSDEEKLIAIADLPNLLPQKGGKKVHHSTVHRWTKKGVRGRVLESKMIGGVRYTSVAALSRFLQNCANQAEDALRAALKQALYGRP